MIESMRAPLEGSLLWLGHHSDSMEHAESASMLRQEMPHAASWVAAARAMSTQGRVRS